MIQINCNISGTSSPVSLVIGTNAYTGVYESANRIIFKLADTETGKTGNFEVGTQVIFANYIIPPPGATEGPTLIITPLVQQLHIQRDQWLLPDGTNYNWKGNIDFMLFHRSLDGVAIEPILAQRYAAGSRSITTLGMAKFIEDFDPVAYGSRYFDHIVPFATALMNNGFYWQPIVFADVQVFGWDVATQQQFLARCATEFAKCYWVFPSLANEYQKNGIDPSNFTKPSGNYWSRGSNVGDSAPFTPGWDYKEWHARRDWPKVLFGNDDGWYVKEGIDASGQMLDYPMPGISSEPIGFWNQNVPNRRSNDPNLARVVGGTSIYFLRGGNFMSEQGLRCDPWDDITNQCAIEFFKGINQ